MQTRCHIFFWGGGNTFFRVLHVDLQIPIYSHTLYLLGCFFFKKNPRKVQWLKSASESFHRDQKAPKVTPHVTPHDPQRHTMNPRRRQMGPHDAPKAPQWIPEGDKWSPNGRPKAPKAAQGSPKPPKTSQKSPMKLKTQKIAIIASFRSQYPHFNVPSGISNINFKTSRY